MASDCAEVYNEEILLAHEIEKQKLLDERQSKESILTKLAKYFSLLEEMRQLEESANDPSRLTGRGQRGDPGRLLREEKQRKRVAKEKPKVRVSSCLQWGSIWHRADRRVGDAAGSGPSEIHSRMGEPTWASADGQWIATLGRLIGQS